MSDMFPPDRFEMIACVEREIGFRTRVYPRFVEQGKMTQAKADREVVTMQTVLAFLKVHA